MEIIENNRTILLRKSYLGPFLVMYQGKILQTTVVLVFFYITWITFVNIDQPLLEAQPFRQTQTALSAYWMMIEGVKLSYQTPVAGYPWSIPMEFPIFQILAAFWAEQLSMNLDVVGRFLSYCFLIICAWPAAIIQRRLGLEKHTLWVFLALLWSSPLYLLWGRTFMIETCALFFTLLTIPFAIDMCREDHIKIHTIILFIILATLGVLQKVTTAGPVLLFFGILIFLVYIKRYKIQLKNYKGLISLALAFVIPLLLLLLWTHYSDIVKEQNPLGRHLTSDALSHWNFASLDQRIDISLYRRIFVDRFFELYSGGLFSFPLILLGLLYGDGRAKKLIFISLLLFAFPIFIFFNLHYRHHYYQTSVAVFYVAAVAFSLSLVLKNMLEKTMKRKRNYRFFVYEVVTVIVVLSNIFYFHGKHYSQVTNPINLKDTQTLVVADVVHQNTPIESAIVIFGNDWNSDLTYYSKRKSFSVPGWVNEYKQIWNDPKLYIGNKDLGAIVFKTTGYAGVSVKEILAHPYVRAHGVLYEVMGLYVWFPEGKNIILPNRSEAVRPLSIET